MIPNHAVAGSIPARRVRQNLPREALAPNGVRSSKAEPLVVSQVDAGSNPVEHPVRPQKPDNKRKDASVA